MPEIPALRVDLLRMVYRHDQTADDAINRAKALEAYVLDAPAAIRPKGPATQKE
jgi:hypothetical protein